MVLLVLVLGVLAVMIVSSSVKKYPVFGVMKKSFYLCLTFLDWSTNRRYIHCIDHH